MSSACHGAWHGRDMGTVRNRIILGRWCRGSMAPVGLGWSLCLPFTPSCVISGKAPNLSEPQYPDLENGANTFLPGCHENSHEIT